MNNSNEQGLERIREVKRTAPLLYLLNQEEEGSGKYNQICQKEPLSLRRFTLAKLPTCISVRT